eukprot:superscaffoldBa00006752_g21855
MKGRVKPECQLAHENATGAEEGNKTVVGLVVNIYTVFLMVNDRRSWNNNPNPNQRTLKKFLVRCWVDPGWTGNALPLETGEPLRVAAVNDCDTFQSDSSFVNIALFDLPTEFSAVIKSCATYIVIYIAGRVARK